MAFRQDPAFDAPIPGQSLTSEPKNRPWRNPPQLDTVEDAMEYYLPRLSSPALAPRLLEVIERGIPLTSLAETIVTGGAMQGIHSIDVGILVSPILVEFMKGMAEIAEVEYNLGDKDKDEEPDPQLIRKTMEELDEKQRQIVKARETMKDKPEEEEQEEPTEPTGLMARRSE